MPISSNFNLITSTGTIEPQTQDVLAEVTQEYLNVFGEDLITTPDTPQGVLITTETQARIATLRIIAQIANQINPNLAGGIYLDAIGALTGFFRSLQTFSLLSVTLTGVAGTTISTSATAQDVNGNLYQNTNIVTLDSSGQISAVFQAVNPGPIVTPANSSWIIINGTLGWEAISNTAASTLGSATQSDLSAKIQRRNTLALQGKGTPEAIKSGLYALNITVNLSFLENTTSNTLVIQGITLLPHSIYVCVSDFGYVGDTGIPTISDLQVATVLRRKKGDGCGWNNTAALVQSGFLASSITVTGLTDTSAMIVGMLVEGTGIPSNTFIATIINGTSLTLTNAATISAESSLSFISVLTLSGMITTSSTLITDIESTVNLSVGIMIQGFGIPSNTTIESIVNDTSIMITNAATATGTEQLNFFGTNSRSIVVIEPATGFPYTVLFDRPILIPILIKITISQPTAPSNAIEIVTSAIQSYIAGQLDQEPGFSVGSAVSCFEIAGAVNRVAPSIYIINSQITLASQPSLFGNASIYIAPNQQAVLGGNIVVVIE